VWGGMPFSIAGKPVSDPSSRPGAGFAMVTPGYFQTFGIQIARGRTLTEQDVAGGIRVAVVNESFAKRFLSGVDALSQRLVIEQPVPGSTTIGAAVEWQIVGVYHDVRNGSLHDDSSPEIDIPFWQIPWPQAHMAVRTAGDPELMARSIAAAVHSVDPDLALANVKTMDQIVGESLVSDRFLSLLYGTFAVVALLLAATGIYGVMAFMVAQRTHEIGLRIALGADKGHVLGIVMREGVVLAATGLGLGLMGAGLVGRAMRSTLYGVGAVDFTAFSVVSVTLMTAALLACYIPAQRAAKVDPMVALRYE
jgi:putative ABC transport system permease protein